MIDRLVNANKKSKASIIDIKEFNDKIRQQSLPKKYIPPPKDFIPPKDKSMSKDDKNDLEPKLKSPFDKKPEVEEVNGEIVSD